MRLVGRRGRIYKTMKMDTKDKTTTSDNFERWRRKQGTTTMAKFLRVFLRRDEVLDIHVAGLHLDDDIYYMRSN